jgi:hypothetical protein
VQHLNYHLQLRDVGMKVDNTHEVNKIFSGYELCQLVKNDQCFRDDLCPDHQDVMCHWVQTVLVYSIL